MQHLTWLLCNSVHVQSESSLPNTGCCFHSNL